MVASRAAGGNPCGPPVTSVIACENSLPGDPPSDWRVSGAGDPTIQGFATSESVNAGQTVSFKIKTPATSYHIDILRLGYYQGNGARKIVAGLRPTASLPQNQPACLVDSTTGLIDCGNWAVSASWTVPSTAVSGVYEAHLVRDDTGGDSYVIFVVRNDSSHSDVLVQTSDETWQAYNDYGGNSLYTCSVSCPPGNPLAYKGAFKVSYNRPDDWAADQARANPFYAEYPMIRFLEANGYDVTYTTGGDVDASGSLLLNHKVFLSSGHDEYWSKSQRANVQAARDAGVNLAFLSGNEMFWKTRWEASIDGSNTNYRTLVTYKETHFNAPTDPKDPPTWTGTWEDPRFSPPADGGFPPNALTGQNFIVNSGTTDIVVPSQYAALRLWRNTAAAKLTSGQSLDLGNGAGTLGYEWDDDPDNGFRPPGTIDLSSTTNPSAEVFTDYGSTTATGSATHHLTLYRAASGALVFGAGTVQWAWGLDSTNNSGKTVDPNMQQATVNLLADMGAQPFAVISGLVPATASTDSTPPTSTITSPAAGANIQDGTKMTVTGTASDSGGGVVAGVEVSTDGGTTWHPATIGSVAPSVTWSYTWVAHGNPATTLESRATDDSGNIETPSDVRSVNIACPCSIWGTTLTNPNDSGDPSAVEVGMQFRSDTFGTVSGIRFYKVSTNTGTHIGSLWTASGQLLAQATFTGETSSGWQQVNFSAPVTINPNTTYVVSYHAPNGHYAETGAYFYPPPSPPPDGGGAVDSPPLHALRDSGSTINGLYTYSASSVFPTSTFNGENYWVDPVFTPQPAPGQVTNVVATAGNGSASLTWSAPATGGPATAYVITPYIGSTAQPTSTVNGTPAPTSATVTGLANATTYTFTVTAVNPNGSGPVSSASNAVTPSAAIIAFLQQATAHAGSGTSLTATLPSNVVAGHRLIVVAGVWSGSGATAASVTDSAGNGYVELLHFKGVDATEESVWTAPITGGGGTRPTITVKLSGSADVGMAVSEYAGLSSVTDASLVDKTAQASGTTSASLATVSSGATAATSAGNELALGAYVDSGFGDTLTAGSGWAQRSNVSNAPDMELLSEDQVLPSAGATPNASVATGANTVWLMATLVLKPGSTAPTAPSAPTNVTASAGNGSATVNWTAPSNGGSTIASYTITPYVGTTAQTSTTLSGSPPPTGTTITGLTNGTAYTFTVTATNAIGTGPPSSASNAVTPNAPTAPGAPTSVVATPGNNQATVTWTAPTNGGSTITSYTITPYIGATAQAPTTITGSPPGTTATVNGLTNGTSYTFTVTATNSIGTGPPSSASNAVTPAAPPGTPTNVTASAGDATATVSWTAPGNGGSTITSYTVTPYIGSTAQTPTTVTGSPPAPVATVSGLTDGVTYTFTVTASNAIGTSPASSPSNAVTPMGLPGAPTNVTATGGNAQANVSWTAPSNGGSTITTYTITPYIGSTAQTPTTLTGSPPATNTTVTGLTNGTTYTFTVTATNGLGTGPASAASNPVTPSSTPTPMFVQQAAAHATGATSLSVTPSAALTSGNRLVVLVGVWSGNAATASTVTDSAGDTFTEVLHFKASDQTEMSVWTAPITAGGGTKPAIKATPTSKADVGLAAIEYSGLSPAAGTGSVDRTAQKSGTTSGAASVSSGATAATTAGGELAVGFYADSGFGDTLSAGSGWAQRTNVSNTPDMEFVVEDQVVALGATPNASVATGANTVWLMSTVVFKTG